VSPAAAMINEGWSCFFTKIDYAPRDKFPPITKAHRKFCVAAPQQPSLYLWDGGEIYFIDRERLHRRGVLLRCMCIFMYVHRLLLYICTISEAPKLFFCSIICTALMISVWILCGVKCSLDAYRKGLETD
jgi:hypothetical protein